MALKIGTADASSNKGASAVAIRLGKEGAYGPPAGIAILSTANASGVDTIVHSAADGLGLPVTYSYYRKVGTALATEQTPLTSSTDKLAVTVTLTEYAFPGAYSYYVSATSDAGTTLSATVAVPESVGYPQTWPTGSLPDHLQDEVGDLSPDTKTAVYAADARNTDAWFHPIDLSSVPTTARGGVLISPEHAMFTAHYPPSVGDTVTYQTNGNEAVSRTVLAVETHPDYDATTYRNDIAVARLSAAVTTVAVAKTLPGDWRAYVPAVSGVSGFRAPTLAFEIGAVQEVSSPLLEGANYSNGFVMNYIDRAAALRPSIVSGDSGQPIFFVVNGEAVLAGLWTGSFYGTFLPDEIPEVNAMMLSLGGGYELQTVDLSAFAELAPGAPTIYDDAEFNVPVGGSLLLYIFDPAYSGTSPITGFEIYADGSLLPDGTFTVAPAERLGPTTWAVTLTGPQESFAGTVLTAKAVNAVGAGDLSAEVTIPA